MIGTLRIHVRAGGVVKSSSCTEVEVVSECALYGRIQKDALVKVWIDTEHADDVQLCRVKLEIQFLV